MVITSKTNEAIFAFVDSDEHEELAMEYVRELVRCKDCKHRPTPDEKGRGIAPGADDCYDFGVDRTCPWLCDDGYYSRIPPDDFFCAYGEVKDEL